MLFDNRWMCMDMLAVAVHLDQAFVLIWLVGFLSAFRIRDHLVGIF